MSHKAQNSAFVLPLQSKKASPKQGNAGPAGCSFSLWTAVLYMDTQGISVRPELRRIAVWRRWWWWRRWWRWQKWVGWIVHVWACPHHVHIWRGRVELMPITDVTKIRRRKSILLHHWIFSSIRWWKHWWFLIHPPVWRVQRWRSYCWSEKPLRTWWRRKLTPGEPSATVSPWITWSRLLHWVMKFLILT